jgi:glycosyltransferase involved in cell wall biosynthesis
MVTTDVPGCRDVVRHGVNGLLVPPRDVSALADALQHLLLNPDICEEMGRSARHIFENEYTLDEVLNSLNECYRRLGVSLNLNVESDCAL